MPFQQLHYTSCESGLSGHSGFQFCAMTPGVRPEVAHEVERLTVYEPPRHLAAHRNSVDLDDYPVNLLYTVSRQTGTVIIAQVTYVGVDFSGRSGNYFAHALVSDAPEDTSRPPLPIELWKAPFWVSSQGERAELPPLPGPLPAGPVTREMVGRLPGSGRVAALGTLISAVDEAIAGGPQVLLIDTDAEAVRGWIAAACYLLGPDLGPRLTFATYSPDPRRCPTHVIGTVESAGPFRADVVAGLRLFDLAQDIVPDLAPSASASLLARVGVAGSAELWDLMATLAPAPAASLAACFPVLACAALLLEHRLTGPETEAAVGWLASTPNTQAAKHYPAAIRAVLRHPLEQLAVERQADLVELALSADMTSAQARQNLAGKVEGALVDAMLARLDHGEKPGGVVRLRTESARTMAASACSGRLQRLDAQHAVWLLSWASAAGAQPAEDVVRRLGRDTILAAVLDGGSPEGLEQAAADWPALRRGALDRLAALPAVLQQSMFTGQAGGIFEAADFAGHPALLEDWLLCSALQGRLSAVDACVQVAGRRRQQGQIPALDGPLLSRLWPRRGWTAAEATQILTSLPPDELTSEPVRQQCASILRYIPPAQQADAWMTFVMWLSRVPAGILREQGLSTAADLAPAIRLIRHAAGDPGALGPSVNALVVLYQTGGPDVRELLNRQLPPLLVRYTPLSRILAACPLELHRHFCRHARELLEREPHDVAFAAKLYVIDLLFDAQGRKAHSDSIENDALAPVLPHWNRRDLNAVAKEVERLDKDAASLFNRWIELYGKPRRYRKTRRSPG